MAENVEAKFYAGRSHIKLNNTGIMRRSAINQNKGMSYARQGRSLKSMLISLLSKPLVKRKLNENVSKGVENAKSHGRNH